MSVAALLALFFPARWAGNLRAFVQPFALLQWPASSAARGLAQMTDAPDEVTPEQAAALQRDNVEMQRQVGHQRLRIDELQQRVAELTGLREYLPDTRAVLVTAPVIAFDSNPRRQGLLIGRGLAERLAAGQWVIAGGASAGRDDEPTGRAVVERQWLIGRVSEVQANFAWVQLTTDPAFREVVRAARVLPDGAWQPADHDAVLEGRGPEGMLIRAAPQNYRDTNYFIVLAPRSAQLPATLALGQVTAARPIDSAPQHFDITVMPWADVRRMNYVYVLITGDGAQAEPRP